MPQAERTEARRDGQDGGATPAAVPDTLRIDGDEVRFRDFRPGDEAQFVEVFRAAFGGFYPSEKPADERDYVTWFAEPHGSHRARVTLAEMGSAIVSVSAGLRRPIKVGEAVLYGTAGGIGTATHPDFQGKAIGRARSRWSYATEDPPRTANVDTRNVGTLGRRYYPVASYGRMGVYLHVLRPWRAAAEKPGATWLNLPSHAALALWGRFRPAVARRGADLRSSTLPAFDDRFESFLERASGGWDVIPLRSVEYLDWRFCDPRAGRFVVRAAEEGSELVGYSVVHAIGSRGHIVDVLALPGRLDVVRALISDSVRQLRVGGATAVECWMLRDQPYARVLREAGFVRLRGRSADVDREVGWHGSGIGPKEQALLASPGTRTHLVRADFDAI